MSVTSQTLSVPSRRSAVQILIAVGLALTIGVVSGSVITRAVIDTDDATTFSAPLWDQQKLDAMAGRAAAVAVPSRPWDAQKLEAMRGRQLFAAATLGPAVALWDQQKLEAMEGRQQAAGA